MRVLVTGASGHVGGTIAATLAAAGHEVVGLSRRGGGTPKSVTIDLSRTDAAGVVRQQVDACDAIVHAAANLDRDPASPDVVLANCLGSQSMLEVAETWGVRQYVYISGVTVIGRPQDLPIDEDHPTSPQTAYHAAKLFGEHLTRIATGRGLNAVSLRLSSPAGPGTPGGRILRTFVERAARNQPLELAGRGGRRQDFVDVRDCGEAVRLCLDKGATGVLNIAAGASVSNLELANTCTAVLGSSSAVEFTGRDDPEEEMRWEIDISRARAVVGFTPAHSLEDSIRAVAEDNADRAHQ